MNVLIIGSGGREHAIAWKLSQSKKLSQLFITPGNPGTEQYGTNVNLNIDDIDKLCSFIEDHKIEVVVVGPEIPLVDGIHDKIINSSLINKPVVIGPKSKGAALEGSKKHAKEFMIRHNIPTARYQSFDKNNIARARAFLDELEPPYVLKADGLAAGKGVLIIEDKEEALQSLKNMIEDQQFGSAGDQVVIEEFLIGIELSVFVLTDGSDYVILPTAKDYKRIGEGDTGLNTGGMGAISPAPSASREFLNKVEETIIKPTIQGLINDNTDYQGFIFIGLMDVNGEPKVIEYNVRLGDPETEAILPRIENDLLELFEAVQNKTLANIDITINPLPSCTVVMASGGYPESYVKGYPILGLDQNEDSLVFHAGTKFHDKSLVTNGGRVLAITSIGEKLPEAIVKCYHTIDNITFEKKYFRKDIGYEIQEEN